MSANAFAVSIPHDNHKFCFKTPACLLCVQVNMNIFGYLNHTIKLISLVMHKMGYSYWKHYGCPPSTTPVYVHFILQYNEELLNIRLRLMDLHVSPFSSYGVDDTALSCQFLCLRFASSQCVGQ